VLLPLIQIVVLDEDFSDTEMVTKTLLDEVGERRLFGWRFRFAMTF
jgi:hypothetical protein